MKPLLIIGIVGAALLSMLCIGLAALGLLVSPVGAQIGQAIDRVFDQGQIDLIPRSEARLNPQAQATPRGPVQQEDEAGILIAGVVADSPAEQAGVARGDILLEVDGQTVNDLQALQDVLGQHQAGDTVDLLVQHGDEQETLTATLAEPNSAPSFEGHADVFLGIIPCDRSHMLPGPEGFKGPFQAQAGLRITEVIAGGPADQAGLERGEVLLSIDGQALDSAEALTEALSAHQPGDSVTLEVAQVDGETREVTVELGEHPENEGAPYLGIRYISSTPRFNPDGNIPKMPEIPDNGESIPGLPFPPGNLHPGALIQEVAEGSPAETAGLEAGQLIQAVDGTELTAPQELVDQIAAHKPGDQVTLTVFDTPLGESKEVQVTLGENPDKAGAAWLGIRFAFLNIETQPEELPEG